MPQGHIALIYMLLAIRTPALAASKHKRGETGSHKFRLFAFRTECVLFNSLVAADKN